MAITIVQTLNSTSSKTLSPTFSGESCGCIVAMAGWQQNADPGGSATCNGAAMTSIISAYRQFQGLSYQGRVTLLYKVAPASGTHDVVISINASAYAWCVWAVSGLHQTAPVKDSATGSGTGTVTATMTVADTNGICVAGCSTDNNGNNGGSGFTTIASNGGGLVQQLLTGITAGQTYSCTGNWGGEGACAAVASLSPAPPSAGGQSVATWFFMKKAKEVWNLDKGIYRPRNTGLVTI